MSAHRTVDQKLFRSNCNFFNEQAKSTYLRQLAQMDNIFFDTKLNSRANSGRPNARKHVTAWCQIACTLDRKHILFKICFKKKRTSRRHGGFQKHLVQKCAARFSKARRFFDPKKPDLTKKEKNRGSYGELRRSVEATHAGIVDPAPWCGGCSGKKL